MRTERNPPSLGLPYPISASRAPEIMMRGGAGRDGAGLGDNPVFWMRRLLGNYGILIRIAFVY